MARARKSQSQPPEHPAGSEVLGIVLVVGAVFLIFAFFSYEPDVPSSNQVGVIGYLFADLFCPALGKVCYVLPALLVYTAGMQFQLWQCPVPLAQSISGLVFVLTSASLLALWYADQPVAQAGGWVGGFLATHLRQGLNQLGAYLVLFPILLVSFMGISRMSLSGAGTGLLSSLLPAASRLGLQLLQLPHRIWSAASESFSQLIVHPPEQSETSEPLFISPLSKRANPKIIPSQEKVISKPLQNFGQELDPDCDQDLVPADEDAQWETGKPKKQDRLGKQNGPTKQDEPLKKDAALPPIIINRPPPPVPKAQRAQPAVQTDELAIPSSGKPYTLPSIELLDPPVESTVKIDESSLHASSQVLETKLHDFGIKGSVVAVRPGPVITTYEFEPAPGVKVNRIVSLADDLQMALRTVSVRILAPIPGKAVVGIEVSNPNREKVYLREILDSPGFHQTDSPLSLALGKDPVGNPLAADLARMPHLLVAGATGTGKSVSLNAMIMSLLYRASPQEVRFIMIDPKMLELSVYENLPHQLSHVITNPKEAGAALQEVVRRMEYRYKLLRDKGVRNIVGYNHALENGQPNQDGVIKLTDVIHDEDDNGEMPPPSSTHKDTSDTAMVHKRLPYLVVIVDELADLMLTVGREIEEPITRLAQMGRASGIHLILATQRPSVDVITGLIKANFPARVSFQVSSRIDSRTILDAGGAERLLGAGDMLFLPPGSAKPQRIHGAFVSEPEISKAVAAIKKQGKAVFDSEFVSALENARSQQSPDAADDDTYDEMYEQARELVIESRQASISWVQRRLRVGYNRAARMIERMEREGLIGPAAEAGKPRQVLVEAVTEE